MAQLCQASASTTVIVQDASFVWLAS